MSNYLVELALVHITLMLAYWLLLRNESQYAIVRFYLLGSVIVALVVPSLRLPKLFFDDKPVGVIHNSVVALNNEATAPTADSPLSWREIVWGIYIVISLFLLFRFVFSVLKLFRLKKGSRFENRDGQSVYYLSDIKGSFSFFNWIFISGEFRNDKEAFDVMLTHERGHARLHHTYDLIITELFRIAFWWLPSTWYLAKEIKKMHEYQADAYVLQSYSADQYTSILITATLAINGMGPVSSFYDGSILKRITVMKLQAKKIHSWKLGILFAIGALLTMGFACTEDREKVDGDSKVENSSAEEIFTIVEKAAVFNGGPEAFYRYIMGEIKYPSEARKQGVEGRVTVQFVIDKDGSVTGVEALKSIGSGCEQEAERVLKGAPAFTPATQQGRPVRVRKAIQIVFKLDRTNGQDNKGIIIVEQLQAVNMKFKIDATYSDGKWKGTVSDESGERLPGVNIIVENTTRGTVSDFDGSFALAATRNENLVLSFIGFDSGRLEGKD